MLSNFDGLTLARVVRFHPHDNSCDCQSLYDGGRWTAVPLMTAMLTESSGRVDWHEPEGGGWDTAGPRDPIAILAKLHNQPIVIGFLAKPVSEMLFKRESFRVVRHASDVYSTIDKDGNVELAHPSGSFFRIATDPKHEDLTAKDYDEKWNIKRNKSKAVWLSMTIANKGRVKAVFRIDPSGNVSLDHVGSLTVKTGGAATFTAKSMTINAPTVINGTVAVHGASLTHNGTNVGDTHVHSGIWPGPSNTGKPV